MLRACQKLGAFTNLRLAYLFYVASVSGAVLGEMLRPRTWRRTVRDVMGRQVLFSGIHAVTFVGFLALVTGLSLVTQSQLWVSRVGGGEVLGALLATMLTAHIGPLVVNFVVIGRSGTAIATELATMKINGDINALERQGFDVLRYIVLPRVLALSLVTLSLSVVFVLIALGSGYLSAVFSGNLNTSPAVFLGSVISEMTGQNFVALIAKTLIPGFATGVICCAQGLSVGTSFNDVPRASTRAVVQSITALFCLIALIVLMNTMISSAHGVGHE